jgi:formate/nitrite transporter FocA (FNT family)
MNERPLSALPSRTARVVAFSSIVLSGLAGGTIGYALVDVQCTTDCTLQSGIAMLIGAVGFAAGMSVVAVLGLRAMGEWRERGDR